MSPGSCGIRSQFPNGDSCCWKKSVSFLQGSLVPYFHPILTLTFSDFPGTETSSPSHSLLIEFEPQLLNYYSPLFGWLRIRINLSGGVGERKYFPHYTVMIDDEAFD